MASLPRIGETISGFTVTELGTIHMLGARTVLFNHESSGAQLLYIQNDDRDLISRTPQLDERDNSHILEHLILSSCQKYPSRDIFFDMDSKSYTTFMNGLTDNTFTCYPVCSQSQEQLVKLMDVFLCCMEEPDALKDKHFYLREAIRYELSSPRGPLTMQGTVLSEDWGHLTTFWKTQTAPCPIPFTRTRAPPTCWGGPTCITGNCPMSRSGKPLSGATATATV